MLSILTASPVLSKLSFYASLWYGCPPNIIWICWWRHTYVTWLSRAQNRLLQTAFPFLVSDFGTGTRRSPSQSLHYFTSELHHGRRKSSRRQGTSGSVGERRDSWLRGSVQERGRPPQAQREVRHQNRHWRGTTQLFCCLYMYMYVRTADFSRLKSSY